MVSVMMALAPIPVCARERVCVIPVCARAGVCMPSLCVHMQVYVCVCATPVCVCMCRCVCVSKDGEFVLSRHPKEKKANSAV